MHVMVAAVVVVVTGAQCCTFHTRSEPENEDDDDDDHNKGKGLYCNRGERRSPSSAALSYALVAVLLLYCGRMGRFIIFM